MSTWQSKWDANVRAVAAYDAEVTAYREARAGARAAWRAKHSKKPYPSTIAEDVLPRRMYLQGNRLTDQQTKLVAEYHPVDETAGRRRGKAAP
jgi:hypothetical protein